MYNLVNMKERSNIPFSERLRSVRIASGLTQQAAADAFGISLRGYCRWEKGEREPQLTTLAAIANYYGVTADYLLGLSDEARAGL